MILFLRGKMEVENEEEIKKVAKRRQGGAGQGKPNEKRTKIFFSFFFLLF